MLRTEVISESNIYESFLSGSACGAFAITLLRIRKTRDTYRIKTELFYDLVTGGMLSTFLILNRFVDLEGVFSLYVSGFVFDFLALLVMSSMLLYPVVLARKAGSDPSVQKLQISLHEVLTSDEFEVRRSAVCVFTSLHER